MPVNEIVQVRKILVKKASALVKNENSVTDRTKENTEQILEKVKSNSIISGSQKLKELQDLHKELKKSSYEPQKDTNLVIIIIIINQLSYWTVLKQFQPRRPTMESIKSAIGKAKLKQMEMASNKSIGTDDEKPDVITTEASTSTNRSKSSKKKKKIKPKKTSGNDNVPKKTKVKKNVDIKLKTKIKANKQDK